jgi:branched-chain amino acid transport system ATP-binding protein
MSAPVLELASISKSFGGLHVTREVSMRIQPGERRLILGPNGAGKTTLFNLIAGDIRADAGTIRVNGMDLTREPARARTWAGLARTYQMLTLFTERTMAHNVVLSLLAAEGASPWQMVQPLARRRDLVERARAVLDRVGLAHKAPEIVSRCSYGEKRRLEIALALAQEPRLLLLDEPLAGLSHEEREGMQRLLGEFGCHSDDRA